MDLRPYQNDADDRVDAAFSSGKRKVLLVLPTGTGKTAMTAVRLMRAVGRNKRCLFVVHRRELLGQTATRLCAFGTQVGVINAQYRYEPGQVDVATVQTFMRRLRNAPPSYDLVVYDEVHRRDYLGMYQVYDALGVPRLGLTATPQRYGGESLFGEWDEMVVGITYRRAVAEGYLAAPVIYCPVRPDLSGVRIKKGDYDEKDLAERMIDGRVVDDSVGHWMRLGRGKRTIVFAVTIAHANELARQFREKGINARALSSDTPQAERSIAFAMFEQGHIDVLVNVALFIEGIDIPAVECVLLARPTRSLTYYLQMCGRASRMVPGKTSYLLLDCSGNFLEHGNPAMDRPWSLQRTDKRQRSKTTEVLLICPNCYMGHGAWPCPGCGYDPAGVTKPVKSVAAQLIHVTDALESAAAQVKKAAEDEYRRTMTHYRIKGASVGMSGVRLQQYVADNLAKKKTVMVAGHPVVIPYNPALLW